jgi:hypothetical protein
MSYTELDWIRRHYERSDLSEFLVHLTRPNKENSKASDTLYKIVKDKQLKGSTTETGFICGDIPAVCFQNAPLHAIGQAIYSEILKSERDHSENRQPKIRYHGTGLAFRKETLYKKGARPVIYERTDIAKEILPKNEYWRIVNLDIADNSNIIDWTHEREWRIKNNYQFDYIDTTLVFETTGEFTNFLKLARNDGRDDFIAQFAGIVVLDKGVL